MIKTLLLLFLAFGAWARGGDSVGSGGVVWACRDAGGKILAAVLTDLYEAKEQFHWHLIIDTGGDPMDLYNSRKAWMQRELPEFYAVLSPRFAYVEQHLTQVNSELQPTHDYTTPVNPTRENCAGRTWEPVNIANFREEDQQVLISAPLWNGTQVQALSKAALLFHEAVYYWMRTYFGSTDSNKSRKITGLLFSDLSTTQMKDELRKILGTYPDHPDGKFMCVMKNSKRNQIYVAYEDSLDNASLTVRERCQDDPDPRWCEQSSVECSEVTTGDHVRCAAENETTRRIYEGRGRMQLEAMFNAHMACFLGSQAVGSTAQDCPDFQFMECKSLTTQKGEQ